MSSTKYTDIKRKNSDTSFVEKVSDFAINEKWKSGYGDLVSGKQTKMSYFWNALSAVGDEIGEEMTQNVMNYIDCASNIDTCKIKALKSICQQYGIDYSILNFGDVPVEVLKILDILSINKTYLLDSKFSQLMEYSRLSVARDSEYEFDYYNAEFFNGDYVNGNIIISLSAATIYQNEDPYNSYFLMEDENPDSYEKRLREYKESEAYKTELYNDSELSAMRVQPPWYKIFVTDEKFKVYPTWLSDYTNESITLDDEIQEVSGYYQMFIDSRMRLKETNLYYPNNSIEYMRQIEDEYEFVGHLSVVIRREDEVSDRIRFNKVYKGKNTGNNLYYVEFIPTRSQTLTQYRKYTYNDSVFFWLVMDESNTRMIASSNSRLDCNSKRCTFYAPMYYGDDVQYCYNGIRIAPDEFVSDVFLDSSIYFINIRNEDGVWKYDLMQDSNINLYKLGIMNICTRFVPDREVVRNVETSVNEDSYHRCLENIFYDLFDSMCNMEYLEPSYTEKKIYKHIGRGGKLSLPELMNSSKNNTEDIILQKNQNRVPLKFNECRALDDIQEGLSSMEDFSETEQKIIDLEISRRAKAQNVVYNQTRFYYYREAKVREYFKYIQQMYNDKYIVGNTIYDVDNRYFVVDDYLDKLSSLIQESQEDGIYTIDLNKRMIWEVSYILADLAINISKIREELKQTSQKYYMRGTSELLFYTINNYLNKNVKANYGELSSYVGKYADIHEIDYIDNTEYFNISQNLEEYKNIKYGSTTNNRYFENTLIEQLFLNNYGNGLDIKRSMSLGYDEISTYYQDVHNLGFNTDGDFQEFMNTVYNTGATYSHINADLNQIEHSSEIYKGVVVDDKYSAMDQIYKNYSGNEFGIDPLYNSKNKAFSSYQIHPFMYNFVEYLDQVFPIDNLYHKYIPEDYDQLIANDIDEYVGTFGQVINQWKHDSFDFTGYSSRFEIENNIAEVNPNTMTDIADRDGMFIEEFVYSVFQPDLSSDEHSGTDAETLLINGNYSVSNALSSYMVHLKMSEYEKKLENDRFSYYAVVLQDMVKYHPEMYDIYKYTVDINGNVLFLLKKYSVPVQDATDEEKRNTRGTLWVRQKNHPCAFPAFNIDTIYFQQYGKLKHRIYKENSDYDIVLDQVNSVFYHDNKDRLNSEIFTNFMGGFYDMELDSTNQYLLLSYTPQEIQNFPETHSSKNVNVMIGRLSKEFDYSNVLFRYGFDTDSTGITKIQNNNLREKLADYVYNEFVGFLRYADSVGACFVQKSVNPETKQDTLKENIEWKSSVIKVNNDFADYEVKYGIKVLVSMFDYTKNMIEYEKDVTDIKYNINPENNICMAYTEDGITIAFESEEIVRNSLVTNYSEFCNSDIFSKYDGLLSALHLSSQLSVDQEISSFYLDNPDLSSEFTRNLDGDMMTKRSLVAWPYVATDFNLKGGGTINTSLVNSFDAFDKYIITLDFAFSGNELITKDTKYYNLNSDMSFSSVMPKEGGVQRMWNNRNLDSLSSVNMEMLGYSSDYYLKEDESQFYEGQDLLAQERALRMLNDDNDQRPIVLEDPFPYKSRVYTDEFHEVSTELPFDIYDQLDVYSTDDGISASVEYDEDGGHIYLHAISAGVELSSANIVVNRKSTDKDIGPIFLPSNIGEFSEYRKVESIRNGSRDIDDTSSASEIAQLMNSYKGLVRGADIRSKYLNGFYIDGKRIIPEDLSSIMTDFPTTVSNTVVKYESDDNIVVDGQEIITIDQLNKMISPIPFTYRQYSGSELTGTTERIVYVSDGRYYYDGVAGEPISAILEENDEIEFQDIRIYGGYSGIRYDYEINPNTKIDDPQLSNVIYKKNTHVSEFYATKENNLYFGTENLDSGERKLLPEFFNTIKYRRLHLYGFNTWFENGKQINYITDGPSYKYGSAYTGSFRNGIYVDKNGKYMICTDGGIAVGTDGMNWKEYPTEQTANQVLSGGGYGFIVKGSGNLLYYADYDKIFSYDSKFNVIKYDVKRDPEVFEIDLSDYGISSYTFGLYNSYNNAILYKYNSETGKVEKTYQYVGNFDEDYRWNSGTIGLSSFSIDNLVDIDAKFSNDGISVILDYLDGVQRVNSSTMYAYVKTNTRNTFNYDKYHVFALNPVTSKRLSDDLKNVKEDTQLSAIRPFTREFSWKDPDLAFKYPSQANIQDKGGFPRNE